MSEITKKPWFVPLAIFLLLLLILIIGVLVIRTSSKYSSKVEYTVTKVITSIASSRNLKVSYNLQGTVKECGDKVLILNNYRYPVSVGNKIKVWIQPDCKDNSVIGENEKGGAFGWILIIFAVVSILVEIYYLIKNKGKLNINNSDL
jgi:hypothetical protein